MKARTAALGEKNLIGATVTKLRKEHAMKQKELMAKMQAQGVDINYTSLSKLEGQTRIATDKELVALSRIFCVNINDLINITNENQ